MRNIPSMWTPSEIRSLSHAVESIDSGRDNDGNQNGIFGIRTEQSHHSEQRRVPSTDKKGSLEVVPHTYFDRRTLFHIENALKQFNPRNMRVSSYEHLSFIDSLEKFTYETIFQERPGTKHGRGGRRHACGANQQRSKIPEGLKIIVWRSLLLAVGEVNEVGVKIVENVRRVQSLSGHKRSPEWEENLRTHLENLQCQVDRSTESFFIRIPSCPLLCICTRTTFSQTGIEECNAMERHVVCTWIAMTGIVFCTCIGMTRFRINGNHSQQKPNTCIHIKGFLQFLEGLSSACGIGVVAAGQIVANIFEAASETSNETYMSQPNLHMLFKNKVCAVSNLENFESMKDNASVRNLPNITPVRCLRGGFYSCAFCDSAYNGSCMHTRFVQTKIINELGDENELLDMGKSMEMEGKSSMKAFANPFKTQALSHFPLPPVSCSTAIQVDMEASKLVSLGMPFKTRCPTHCVVCSSPRDETSKKIWKDGVLMCTGGPCSLHVEEYDCINSDCTAKIRPEGRDQHILLLNMSSAGTHAMLRRELIGVVLGNGTLNSRLRHFHSQVLAVVNAGGVPSSETVPCRSVRIMQEMCVLMLKLMTLEPDRRLFRCDVCESATTSVPVICVDGIQLGYRKSKQRRLKNISETCAPLPRSTSRSRGNTYRPLTGLIRKNSVVKLFLAILKGCPLSCTRLNVSDFVMCIRILSGDHIPAEICGDSVCGSTPNDFSNDIGEHSHLISLRMLTNSIFHQPSLLYRFLSPLHEFVSQLSEEAIERLGSLGTQSTSLKLILSQRVNNLRSDPSLLESGIPWASSTTFSPERQKDLFNDLYNMFCIFLQGPICQFIRRSDLASVQALASLCLDINIDGLLEAIRYPYSIVSAPRNTSILSSLRIIQAGLQTIVEIERNVNHQNGMSMRFAFGHILHTAHRCLFHFYKYYDAPVRKSSALIYAKEWKSTKDEELLERMKTKYGLSETEWDSDLDGAYCTGRFFPGRPQVRPLPFNGDKMLCTEKSNFGLCSKDYLQAQKSFTPGAMIISCACKSPIILGTKVLYRNEGPKVVLDMIISRFAKIPRFVVYDFACGLYNSCLNTLWWVLENTTIVSDKFHIGNHKHCSPGYHPRAYFEPDNKNTVSHEQRNSRIRLIFRSLRNGGHEYYISLLAYQAIIQNIRAKAKLTKRFESRSNSFADYDLEWCYFYCLEMN